MNVDTPASTFNKGVFHSADTRLYGYQLILARCVWIVLVFSVLLVFALGIPETFKIALVLRPETRMGLEQFGLSAYFYALYIVVLDTITMIVFALFAVLTLWRRSNDWMVMFVGIMLLLTCMLYTAPAFETQVPLAILACLVALAEISQVMFVFLFPDGRFVPRWSWFLLFPLLVWRPAIWGLVYLPNFLSLKRSGEDFYYIPQNNEDLALLLALLTLGIVAQVYRYRYRSTLVQKQQTKWLVLGIVVVVVVLGSYVIMLNTLVILQQLNSEALLARLLSRTINHIALTLMPVSLTFSILRYRLWDIDILINRTLVYSTLTGALALVYSGLVISLQYLLQGFIGGNQLAVVGSTLVIVALFQPLRGYIQRAIDRRFYRQKYDAVQIIENFSAQLRLRSDVDLPTLTNDLLMVVQETMQPTHVSLWLQADEQQRKRHETL